MTPSRPYIMRALYEWIVDNDCTPYVLVDATVADVMVPQQYVKDGQIVLNISPGAVMDLNIGNDAMAFNGRFGGVATDIYVPIPAVVGIYARENGQGMVFEPEESTGPPDEPPPDPIKPEGRPALKIVK
ncbi:MAG: ClpXP protease specificity-enhancing factor [Gammaproteobacteria bacterium]|jgi:stringent starvation protein B|nr:ClpXP protease specificity-enhancing factor [Gammaproteobacteria bacterium]MDH5171951.1 ClpXP protease specificity-enhancing factor [Gammaproteobacteria bacterium]